MPVGVTTDDARGVNELPGARIAVITKANCIGQLLDLWLLAGEKMPAIAIGLVVQMLVDAGNEKSVFFFGRVFGSFVRIPSSPKRLRTRCRE